MFPQWRLTHITRHDVGKHGPKCHILSSWVQSAHLAHLWASLPSTALHVANNLKEFVYILQQYLFKIQLQCCSTFIMFSLWQTHEVHFGLNIYISWLYINIDWCEEGKSPRFFFSIFTQSWIIIWETITDIYIVNNQRILNYTVAFLLQVFDKLNDIDTQKLFASENSFLYVGTCTAIPEWLIYEHRRSMLLTPFAVFTAFSYKCLLGSLISNHCGPSPQRSPILPKNIMFPFLDFYIMIFFYFKYFSKYFCQTTCSNFLVVFVWTWISQKLKIQTWNFQCPFLPSKWINSCEIGIDRSKNVSVLRTKKNQKT